MHFAPNTHDHSRHQLSCQDSPNGDQYLRGRHQSLQSFPPEPAQADLVGQHHAARAEQRLQTGGNGVDEGKRPSAIPGSHPHDKAAKVKGPRQPEGNLHQHTDLRPQQRPRRHWPVQQDIRLLLVKEHFTRRGSNEQAEEDKRHPMQINGQRKDRLPLEEQCEQAE